MTTITINDETKEELLKIAAKLQIERKEKINYDTTVKFLIATYLKKKDRIVSLSPGDSSVCKEKPWIKLILVKHQRGMY